MSETISVAKTVLLPSISISRIRFATYMFYFVVQVYISFCLDFFMFFDMLFTDLLFQMGYAVRASGFVFLWSRILLNSVNKMMVENGVLAEF